MSLYSLVVQTLGALALVAVGLALVGLSILSLGRGRGFLRARFGESGRPLVALAWLVALVAMAGSLYLSDVVGLLPCTLCWYQRIAMYPLVAVLLIGLIGDDPSAPRLALPLPLIGLAISVYHVSLQLRPAVESAACGTGVPCSQRYLAIFGFVSIPTMAGAAFLLVGTLLLAASVARGSSA